MCVIVHNEVYRLPVANHLDEVLSNCITEIIEYFYEEGFMPAGAISFDIVLAGTFYFRMLSARASNSERAIAMLYEFK